MGQNLEAAAAGKTGHAGAVMYSSPCGLGLAWRCLKSRCVLISWEFPRRLQVEAEVPGVHFPLQNLRREAEGVTTPCMQMQGALYGKAWRNGRYTGRE